MSVVAEGEKLFHSPDLGTNKVSCDQCHPNAANTHPETYPKFQQQIGRVINLSEMINWCIRNPLEGEPLPLDDARMTALLSYMTWERRGVASGFEFTVRSFPYILAGHEIHHRRVLAERYLRPLGGRGGDSQAPLDAS